MARARLYSALASRLENEFTNLPLGSSKKADYHAPDCIGISSVKRQEFANLQKREERNMAYKRFLRDGIFERLIDEVKETIHRLPDEDQSPEFLRPYLNAILISYETSKLTLERIEETIESARSKDDTGEICIPLSDAATHIKSGVLTLHEMLWRNLESLRADKQVEFDEFEALVDENYLSGPPSPPSI